MKDQWIVVASQKSARIFQARGAAGRLKLLHTLRNPLSQMRNRALQRHEPGDTYRFSGRVGVTRHRAIPSVEPREMAALQFAKRLCLFLEKEYDKLNFTQLVITAEPHFLGKIKKNLDRKTSRSVAAWIRKDLENRTAHDVLPHLKNNLVEIAARVSP